MFGKAESALPAFTDWRAGLLQPLRQVQHTIEIPRIVRVWNVVQTTARRIIREAFYGCRVARRTQAFDVFDIGVVHPDDQVKSAEISGMKLPRAQV